MTIQQQIASEVTSIFNNNCSCSECSSGISPISYFFDLLNYSYKNLSKKSGIAYIPLGNVSTGATTFFRDTFMQNLEGYPINCKVLNKKMTYLRFAVDSLLSYRQGALNGSSNSNYSTLSSSYLNVLYTELLKSIGLNSSDLSFINRYSVDEKKNKAKQLGLEYSIIYDNKDIFDYLTLTNSGVGVNALTENNIEILFGVEEVSLTRNRLNNYPIFNLSHSNVYTKWDFDNIIPILNTDKDGIVNAAISYTAATVSPVAPPKFSISVTINRNGSTVEIANGTLNVTSGTITSAHTIVLSPVNNSGLSGTITFNGFNSATVRTASFSLSPMVLCWKLQFLLSIWCESDLSLNVPVIEPDLIRLNDFNLNTIGNGSVANALTNLYNTRSTILVNKRTALQGLEVSDDWSLPTDINIDGIESYKDKMWILAHGNDNIKNFLHKVDNIDNNSSEVIIESNKTPLNDLKLTGELKSMTYSTGFLYVLSKGEFEEAIVKSIDPEQVPAPILGYLNFRSLIANSSTSFSEEESKFDTLISNEKQFTFAKRDDRKLLTLGRLELNATSVDVIFGGDNVTSITDKLGNIYSVNTSGNYVSKTDRNGVIIWKAGYKDGDGNFIGGLMDGQFLSPTSITIKDDVLYVLDNSSKRIQQLGDNGKDFTFLNAVNIDGNNSFAGVSKIRIDKSGNLYSLSTAQNSVRVFDRYGTFKYKIGKTDNTAGSGETELNQPSTLCIDDDLILYIADKSNNRIQIFDAFGNYRNTISTSSLLDELISVDVYVDGEGIKHLIISGMKDGSGTKIYQTNDFGVLEDPIPFSGASFTVKHAIVDKHNRLVIIGSDTGTGKIIWCDKSSGAVLKDINEAIMLDSSPVTLSPLDVISDKLGNLYIANGSGKNVFFIANSSTVANIHVEYVLGGNSPTNPIDFANFENDVLSISVGTLGELRVAMNSGIVFGIAPQITLFDVGTKIKSLVRGIDGTLQAIITKSDKTKIWRLDEYNTWTETPFQANYDVRCGAFDSLGNVLVQSDEDNNVIIHDKSGKIIREVGIAEHQIEEMRVNPNGVWLYNYADGGTPGLQSTKLMGNFSRMLNDTETLGTRIDELVRLQTVVKGNIKGDVLLKNYNIERNELASIFSILNSFENFGDITDQQEGDLLDFLMMIHKRGFLYQDWLLDEQNLFPLGSSLFSVFISPLYFSVLSIPDERAIELNPRLAPIGARRNYTRTLSGRKTDLESIKQIYTDMISDAENSSLGFFIDVLIADSETKIITGVANTRKLEWLSSRLFIDFASKEKILNPRVSYFIQLLQGILTRIRTGSIVQYATGNPNPLDIALSHQFDSTWDIMGSYATWRSAMFVNFYPENYLLPSIRDYQSSQFKSISNRISEQNSINPIQADEYANEYLSYLKDVSSLSIATSIQVKIPQNLSLKNAGTKDVIYHFAISSTTFKIYYSVTDLAKPDDQQINAWVNLEQLKDIEAIVGAVEIFDEKKSESKLLLFVKNRTEANLANVSFLEYNISTNKWADDSEDVSLEHNIGKSFSEEIELDFPPENIVLPFDRRGFNVILEESPEKVVFKDRLQWDSFNRNPTNTDRNRPFLPAFTVSIWWSKVIMICFFDYSEKKLIATKNYSQSWKSNPLYVKSNKGNVSPSLSVPADLNFEPKALVRIPAGSNVSNNSNLRFILIGVNRGQDWSKSEPLFAELNQFGEPIKNSFRDDSKTTSSSFGGFYYNSFTAGKKFLHTFWFNGNNLIQVSLSNSNFIVQRPSDLLKTSIRQVTQSSDMSRCIAVYKKGNQMILGNASNSGNNFTSLNNNKAITPFNEGPSSLNLRMKTAAKTTYASALSLSLTSQTNNTYAVKNIIAEGYYYLPILLASSLAQNGFYEEALDYYRLVYDYTLNGPSRKLFPGLKLEESGGDFMVPSTWLSDPYNPHALAIGRKNTYTKYTVASIVKTLIDYADDQFAQDTVETVNVARNLYLQAQALILDNGLIGSTTSSSCATTLAQLNTYDTNTAFSGTNQVWLSQWARLKSKASKISNLEDLKALCDPGGIISQIFTAGGATNVILAKVNQAIDGKIAHASNIKTMAELMNASRQKKAAAEMQQLRDMLLRNLVQKTTKKESEKKAQVFANVIAVKPEVLRTGVNVQLVEPGATPPIVNKLAPVRLEALRQAPQPVSVRITQILTQSTSFTFTNKQISI
jgi:hypothetical protein